MWQAIEQAISRAVGEPFEAHSRPAIHGGCINQAVCLQGERLSFMVKLNRAERLPMFEAEFAGLATIRDSHSIRAPEPVAYGHAGEHSWLALEFIDFSSSRANTAALLGEQLANMHRHSTERYGWDRDNTIGTTPQTNTWSGDWITFLRVHRLGYQLSLAKNNGCPAALIADGERLLDALPAWFEGYQPLPSLLHGDLWGGNWAADSDGRPVIFDPAVYFGDRETDIAMTELFGGFEPGFYQAYEATWPLHPGYRQRKHLYQLYHILNHFNLFGGGYGRQAGALIDRLLAGLKHTREEVQGGR
jgi:protein-ribulosamine 3-kinase